MSRFTPRFNAVVIAAATALLAAGAQAQTGGAFDQAAAAATAGSGLTREQVRAELMQARQAGTMGEGGEVGDSERVLAARVAFNEAQARTITAQYAQQAAQTVATATPSAGWNASGGAAVVGQGLQLPADAGNVPDSRVIAIDAPSLFVADSARLTDDAAERIRNYADAMHDARIEVIVISIPLSPDTPPVQANRDAEARARAIKEVLASQGIAAERIYTEVRLPSAVVIGAVEPVVIETVAAFG